MPLKSINPMSKKYDCVCIYSHEQTDCFGLSDLFSVARHVGRLKPRSKPVQLHVRLSIRLLGQRGNYKVLCSNSSSSVRLFTFLCRISYQRAQFFRRALHYASDGQKFLRQSAHIPKNCRSDSVPLFNVS